jgi:hypothetical protein
LVAKQELVSNLQVLLQAPRLKVAQTLPDASTLVQELLNFKIKLSTAANNTFEAWRENPQDDLVQSIAIAAWIGERAMQRLWVVV